MNPHDVCNLMRRERLQTVDRILAARGCDWPTASLLTH